MLGSWSSRRRKRSSRMAAEEDPESSMLAAMDTSGGGSVLRRRKRVLLLAIGVVVLVTAGGLVGATFVKSPAQVAAEQAPVAPSVLTAPVTRQVVGATVVLRGTVAGAEDVQATPAPIG